MSASIPMAFTLANRKWRVKFKDLGRETLGKTNDAKARIDLHTKLLDPSQHDLLVHSFLHELLHASAMAMGWKRLNNDEYKIDALAGVLAQALAQRFSAE